MAKKRVEPGIYKTSRGRYQVIYRDPAGRQRAKHFGRLIDARDFKADIRIKVQRGEYTDPRDAKTPFEDWAEKYLEEKLRLRPRTKEKYESSLRTHLFPVFGEVAVGRITRDDVQAWVIELHERGYEPETIRGHYDLMAAIMRRSEEDRLITKSPCRSIELPAVIAREKRYITEDEVERLVEAVEPRYKALAYTAAYLGLRWQEIAGLRRQALDIRPGRLASVRVVTTIERANGLYRAVEYGKSKAARRTLKMPEFLRDVLRWHLKMFKSDEWVFPGPEGGFLRYDNFRPRVWNPAVERAGLAPLTFHELRHTAAAFMINDGADPLQVKRRMGHEDIRTTFDTYGHLFPDREEDLVAALDARKRRAHENHVDYLLTLPRDDSAEVVDLDEKRRSDPGDRACGPEGN
jgi:integrase